MARVLAYHPQFVVDRAEGGYIRLVLSMDDWYNNEEIFEQLAVWTGATSLGGAISAIRNNNTPGDRGNIISARIENVRSLEPSDQVFTYDSALR